MNFKPLADRVLVRRIEVPETTASGLHIPDAARERPTEGVVVAVGTGQIVDHVRVPMVVEDVVLLREDEILGVFNG
jgi:chaperonin GroES